MKNLILKSIPIMGIMVCLLSNNIMVNASEEKVKKFKKDNEIEDNATPEECFYIMKEEYEIEKAAV